MSRPLLAALICLATPAAALPSWDWQLSGPFDLTRNVDAISLDPDGVTADQMATLAARVPLRICYVSVGTLEDWRKDMTDFPSLVIGKTYDDWPDERFLDIRRTDLLLPLMQARFDRCKALGFNAIEPDNIDLHINDTGFDISATDVTSYMRELTALAHGMDLLIGQKNASDLTAPLVTVTDFAITENCMTDGWCDDMAPFTQAGKAIFAAEYDVPSAHMAVMCTEAARRGISMIFKDIDLHAGGASCQ